MRKRSAYLYTAAASALTVATMAFAGAAGAQTAQPPVSDLETVVITGSRVNRTGFDAPTPTTVLSAQELAARGAAQVGEFLNEVPSFRATQTPQSNPHSARGAGQFFADLRGLGSIRTLTLVNGRRHVPSSPDGQVDLNLIPSVLVSRIDVVTGGASAQWGSDAVAGVVNIVLDNNLRGFKADVSYGETTYGDNQETRLSAAYGGTYAGDRGRFLLGGEFVKSKGVLSHWDRAFGRDQQELVSYSGTRPAGAPSRFYASGVTPTTMTWGGLIIGPNAGAGQPLNGIQFGPGGSVLPYNYGTNIGGSAINFSGGEPGFSIRSGHTLIMPVERQVLMAATDYDVTDKFNVFAEASYGHAGSKFNTAYTRDSVANAIVIQRDNAFLPAQVASIMAANNIASFSLGREHKDFGKVDARNFNTTKRITLGGRGQLGGGWTWDAYYQYGQNRFDSVLSNLKVMQNLRNAADAVRDANGAIVCRSAAARAGGCVPINLFGFGSPSAQAIDYVNGTAYYDVHTTQEVIAANINGEVFNTWAGPVSFAAGVERREEKSVSRVDAISQANGFAYGNPKNFTGSYEVKEAYAETVIPLLKDQPFARALDLNLAARYTDYSTSGGVWTWKAGVSYDINDDIRLRATRSRDIRAPNNSELYAETSSQQTLRNPYTGSTVQINVVNRSSPTLQPEEADTFTVGAVYSPSFFRGLRMSVDYYDIDIQGAIAAYGPQVILDNCAGGQSFFCAFVDRSGNTVNRIDAQLLNIAGYTARGIDFEAGYDFDLLGGRTQLRFVGTRTLELTSDDGLGTPRTYNAAGVITSVGSVVDRAGQTGGFNSSSVIGATSAPKWSWNTSLTYSRDKWSAMLQGRYVGGGVLDATLVGPGDRDYDPASPISIANNRIDSRFYVNASASYDVNERTQIYGVVNNIGNVQPPFPYTAVVGFYDKVGRTYKAGVRFTF